MVDPNTYGYGDSYPTRPSTWHHTPIYFNPGWPKPIKSIFLRKYHKYPWKKGTKINHTVDNRIQKTLSGFRREVFHPPKYLLSGLR